MYSLGRKDYGLLGLGEDVSEEKSEPTAIPTLKDVKCSSVNCGSAVSFAVAENGQLNYHFYPFCTKCLSSLKKKKILSQSTGFCQQ